MTTAEESASAETLIRDAGALGWLLAIFANIGVGVWLLQRSAPPEPPPLLAFVLFLLAALILYTMHRTENTEPTPQWEVDMQPENAPAHDGLVPWVTARVQTTRRWRLALLAIAVLGAGYTLLTLPHLGRLDSYTVPFLTWILSIAAYAVALAPPRRSAWREWALRVRAIWAEQRLAVLLFLSIVLLALSLRASFLESIPYTLGGDEASQGLEAVRVLSGEIRNPFTTGWLGVPTLSFFFNSFTVGLMGMTKTALRLPWAFVGAATVAAAFFLVRRLQSLTLALATAGLLAVYHYHIHFSRLGSNQIADPLFVSLSLLFLYRALDRGQIADWIATGAVTGFALYFYAGARFTPVVVVAVLGFALLWQSRSRLREHVRGILAMVGAFALVAAPMLQYAIRFPADFNARLNQVGIIQSGWLAREMAAGRGLLPTLWQQVEHAVLAFNYYPDRTVWYGLEQPLLDPFFGALFAVGLLYCTMLIFKHNERRVAPFVIWWWGGMLAGGVLTESPPSSQRLTTLTVPTCFFIAFALWHILGLARSAIRGLPQRLLLALGVLAFAIVSLNLYFFEFTPKYRYGGHHAELATTLAPIFDELDRDYEAYFVGAPWMYWGFATIPYLSPDMHGQDIEEPLTAPPSPDLLRPGRGAIFIVRPERSEELAYIQQAFPEGRLSELYSRAPNNELLATLYVVPPR